MSSNISFFPLITYKCISIINCMSMFIFSRPPRCPPGAVMMHSPSNMLMHAPRLPIPALVRMSFGDNLPNPPGINRGVLPQSLPVPPNLLFTQDNLDMVLYGYARTKGHEQIPGHALSGLRLGQLSHGKFHQQIAGQSRQNTHTGNITSYP